MLAPADHLVDLAHVVGDRRQHGHEAHDFRYNSAPFQGSEA
jgi:hypothetical protein